MRSRWFKKRESYKKPSGRILGRRLQGGVGVYKTRGHFWQTRRFKIYLILVAIALLFLSYLLFWSGVFKIQRVDIQGTKNLKSENITELVQTQIQEKKWLLFSQSNLFFFDKAEAIKNISDKYVVDSVKIQKRPLGVIKVIINEKPSQIVWITDNNYYYLDPNGIVIEGILVANVQLVQGTAKEAKNAPGEDMIDLSAVNKDLPMVYDLSNTKVEVGKTALDSKLIDFIARVRQAIPEGTFNIQKFEIPDPTGHEVRLTTDKGYNVYFNSDDSLERQIANMNLVIREKVKDSKINYIDLRAGNRVYIK